MGRLQIKKVIKSILPCKKIKNLILTNKPARQIVTTVYFFLLVTNGKLVD